MPNAPENPQVPSLNLEELATGLAKTELLYLTQMQLATAEVSVVRVVPEKKSHAYLMLDKTIFHPKGGGQPSDHGVIRSPQYALTLKKAIYHKGVVVHWVKLISGTPNPGPATCELDWGYRYLVMKRHTAAHLLDHCLAKVTAGRVETTDSWLDEPCYVGYAGEAPDAQALSKIQDLANAMISGGGLVQIDFLTGEQSKSLLQSAPNFERLPDLDEVRTVTIAGCEPIPCGGTHVSDISQIGRMSVVRAEQMLDQSFRLHFSVQE